MKPVALLGGRYGERKSGYISRCRVLFGYAERFRVTKVALGTQWTDYLITT